MRIIDILSFNINFNTRKYQNPAMRFYNPSASTVNRMFAGIYLPGTGFTTSAQISIYILPIE